METASATFEVQDLFNLPDRFDTFVAGKVVSGVVRVGMQAIVKVDGGLFWTVNIKSVEGVRTTDGRANIALALDTPTEEAQVWLKGLCCRGDILAIEPRKVANQSTDPTPAPGTPPAGQESRHG